MTEGCSRCVCPFGCMTSQSIDSSITPKNAIRFLCTNAQCPLDKYMHKICFQVWQNSSFNLTQAGKCLRPSCEKCSPNSEERKPLLDVIYESCPCPCGKGYLKREMTEPGRGEEEGKKRRNRRRSGNKLSAVSGNGVGSSSNFRARSRTFSVGCTRTQKNGSPPNQQPLAHSLDAAASHLLCTDFFSDVQVQASGSIFKRRESMSAFTNYLPRWKINGINIKLEDDCPQGNDETRIFVLTNLGDYKRRQVCCILCRTLLSVYDRYPLIDGTFFLSPVNHGETGVMVKYEGRELHLLAICMCCLENRDKLCCVRCGSHSWFLGNKLVLGTLYSYDILAAVPCCQPQCSSCRMSIPLPSCSRFSVFTETSDCPHCGYSDVHFIRRLDSVHRHRSVSVS
ncbi:hypothetical protein M514_06216 [Trichuris suis]|uniref:Uncharacterized protein n=1 Tax=Trichuris suis TaxID=68888 RepID=A0A085M6R0_9BILA|nr:hypothetical protein M513_06216 [Trichuris suis]KFD63723.1 hypothetical protein M514_06216 [Trichuris suis]